MFIQTSSSISSSKPSFRSFYRTASHSHRLYIPYFSAYILLGIISSIGNTYFIEQATDLNHHVGSLYVLVVFLPIFKEFGALISLCLCSPPVRIPFTGIVEALIVGTICCITAAKMETRRLGIVESKGFVDNTTDTIAMSMFLLVPQFLLIGLTESITWHVSVYDFDTYVWFWGIRELKNQAENQWGYDLCSKSMKEWRCEENGDVAPLESIQL